MKQTRYGELVSPILQSLLFWKVPSGRWKNWNNPKIQSFNLNLMARNINPDCSCKHCLAVCPATREYCTLRCRDAAKLKRRRANEGQPRAEVASPSSLNIVFYPDSDKETLPLFAQQYLDGSLVSPTYFAAPAGTFVPPPGISYHVDPVLQIGKMSKL